ncbi:MAG TPA: hypothetical protein VF340_08855 [Methyloceanibacter sp.]|jgi:hypothetical protein
MFHAVAKKAVSKSGSSERGGGAQAGDELHLALNGDAVTEPVQNGVAVAYRHVDNHAAQQTLQCLPGLRFGSRARL